MTNAAHWRELTADEVRRLGIFRPPEADYRFYLFEHTSAVRAHAINVVGVWEEQHKSLLLHVRLMHFDTDRTIFPAVAPWAYPHYEQPPDAWWPSAPASQLERGFGFAGSPSDLAAFVSFLGEWAGEPVVVPAESVDHFMPAPLPAWRLLGMQVRDDAAYKEDATLDDNVKPFASEILPTEQEEPSWISDWLEVSPDDWEDDSSEEGSGEWFSETPESPPDDEAQWASDVGSDGFLYFGEPAYQYIPDADIPTATTLYTLVIMPTWEACEGATWYAVMKTVEPDGEWGTINVDAVEIHTFRLADLHDPDFEPYIDSGIADIVFNRAALRDYIALLKHYIERHQRTN